MGQRDPKPAFQWTPAEAHARGYEATGCSECRNLTMRTVGPFTMRCDTCGTTMGIGREPQTGELKASRIEQHFRCEAIEPKDDDLIPQHSEDGC